MKLLSHRREQQAIQEKILWCAKCKHNLPFSLFVKSDRYPNRGCAYTCRPCVKEKSRIDRANGITHRFTLKRMGITQAEYDHYLARQAGVCAICKRNIELVKDHDHVTGKFRGLLCRVHNQALGMFEDNKEFLDNAKIYLDCNPATSPRRP